MLATHRYRRAGRSNCGEFAEATRRGICRLRRASPRRPRRTYPHATRFACIRTGTPDRLRRPTMDALNGFGMDTITQAGPLEAKLAAMAEAGFSQVMLSARDIVGHPGGTQAAVA